jgi:1-aminocyclopropane-1-carboxylate deaminase
MHIKPPSIPSVLFTRICDPLFEKQGISLSLARLDLLPYPGGGNKTFKLKYNLIEAKSKGFDTIITFGGAYSNHLLATAESAKHEGFKSIGIVRGEQVLPLNQTLARCQEQGMSLHYMSREDYRKKQDANFIKTWLKTNNIPDGYLIPEGGSNRFAVKGVAELMTKIPDDTALIVSAVGTGGTLAGLISGMHAEQEVWGVAALKGDHFLHDAVQYLLYESETPNTSQKHWKIIGDYHFEGYAKCPEELLAFIKSFYQQQGIVLDPIYTGKMMYALFDLASKGLIPTGKKIVALHTGGTQAWNGMPEKKMYIST